MATYKITNLATGKVEWTESEKRATAASFEVDTDGEPLDVELYCDHSDTRVCQGFGHA